MTKRVALLGILIGPLLLAQDGKFPEAEITNGLVKAKLLLPDNEHGYYRGSRFDWSGVIESLTYKDHSYFGKWFPSYDARLHDAIMGPVDEFRGEDGGLGYNDAKAGGMFIKIGIGVLRKLDDEKYSFVKPYPVVNPGKRIVTPERDRVTFVHELADGEGYGYVYKKVVRLAAGKPYLVIEHTLKNTGKKAIDTTVYNHDFYMLDGKPTGSDNVVRFAFEAKTDADFKNLAQLKGKELTYNKELAPRGESVAGPITGFGASAKDNDFTVENRATGAGVREIGDRPLSSMYFWSIHTTICPEGYIKVHVEPGKTYKWKITYKFYSLTGTK